MNTPHLYGSLSFCGFCFSSTEVRVLYRLYLTGAPAIWLPLQFVFVLFSFPNQTTVGVAFRFYWARNFLKYFTTCFSVCYCLNVYTSNLYFGKLRAIEKISGRSLTIGAQNSLLQYWPTLHDWSVVCRTLVVSRTVNNWFVRLVVGWAESAYPSMQGNVDCFKSLDRQMLRNRNWQCFPTPRWRYGTTYLCGNQPLEEGWVSHATCWVQVFSWRLGLISTRASREKQLWFALSLWCVRQLRDLTISGVTLDVAWTVLLVPWGVWEKLRVTGRACGSTKKFVLSEDILFGLLHHRETLAMTSHALWPLDGTVDTYGAATGARRS